MSNHAGRRVSAIIGSALLVATAACGGSDSTDSTEPSPTAASLQPSAAVAPAAEVTTTTVAVTPTVIGLVAPSAVDDASFTQSMVDSLGRLALERPLEIEVAADLSSPDVALPAAEAFAAGGVDVVIVHGSQYRSVVERVATDHPDVAFAWGTAADDVGLPNVFSYSAAADEGGYVNGVIAAGLTTTGMVGAVGPIQIGDAGLYVDGFRLGALAADPDVQVSIAFLDSYTDTLLAEEAATVMTGFGADVLTSTSQSSAGVLDIAGRLGLPFLGTQSSAIPIAPSVVVAAQVYHWEVSLEELLTTVEAGGAGHPLEPLTLANGGLTIEFNEEYALPADVAEAAEAAVEGLTDGSVDTGLG
jgi:basic membrane protein A